jgi:hypothetical protein
MPMATFQSRQPALPGRRARSARGNGRSDFCVCSRAVLGFVSASLLSAIGEPAAPARRTARRFHRDAAAKQTDSADKKREREALVGSPTPRRSRCMTGAVRGGRLPSHRAEAALRPRGPAHRRSDARPRPTPVAAALPRATDVRPPADPACRHTCASRRGSCRSPRRIARRRAARADPGVLTLKPGSAAARFGKPTRLRLTRGVGPGQPIARTYGR